VPYVLFILFHAAKVRFFGGAIPVGKNRQRVGKYWWRKGSIFVGMNRILLVEDDPSITSLLTLHFQAPSFNVTACDKGATALEWLDKEPFHLLTQSTQHEDRRPAIAPPDLLAKLKPIPIRQQDVQHDEIEWLLVQLLQRSRALVTGRYTKRRSLKMQRQQARNGWIVFHQQYTIHTHKITTLTPANPLHLPAKFPVPLSILPDQDWLKPRILSIYRRNIKSQKAFA